jgi:valyl-tRNA synthetase
VERLTKVAPLTLGPPAKEVGASAVLPDGSAVFVPLGDAIDLHRERRRLSEEVARLDGLLAAQAAKLANTQFTSRAPADVVARERAKEQAWRDQRATVAEKRAALGT